VAKPEGEGVRRTWLVSIDSLQAFRDARQSSGNLPRTDRAAVRDAHIAAEGFGNPIRELADRLAEEAARAAEYQVRLELTEQAQTSLEEELATERRRREEAERERDELRELCEELRQGVEVPSELQEATEKGSEETSLIRPRCAQNKLRFSKNARSSRAVSTRTVSTRTVSTRTVVLKKVKCGSLGELVNVGEHRR
jgi:chromosome segregation ATPase